MITTARHRQLLFPFMLLLALVWAGQAAAYTFETFDVPFPALQGTTITGLNGPHTRVGVYLDANRRLHGFVRGSEGDLERLLFVQPKAINASGQIVGVLRGGLDGRLQGFFLDYGTATPLQPPRGFLETRIFLTATTVLPPRVVQTEAVALNDSGQVVGFYSLDGETHVRGLRYDHHLQQYLPLEVPGGGSTLPRAIDPQGNILGRYVPRTGPAQAFRWDAGTKSFTFLTIPTLAEFTLVGDTASGFLAGNTGTQGFVYDGETVELIAVPDASVTELFGIRQDGVVFGRYQDAAGVDHGFLAFPEATTKHPKPKEPRRGQR